VQLDYNGDGIGVTFGGPLPIPAGTFDSGLDQFLPPIPPPEYVPMDMSGITPVDPSEIPRSSINMLLNMDTHIGGRVGKEIKNAYIARGILGLCTLRIYTSCTTYGAYQYTDDGNIESKSTRARNQFLVDHFYKMSEQNQIEYGQSYKVEIPTWTSVWETIQRNDDDGKGYNFTTEGIDTGEWDINKASFWLGGMWDFQVKGVYWIRVYPSPDNPEVKWVDIRPSLDWRWVDRIDANSWWGYNWEVNDTGAGIGEGLVDFFGDKILGASFDIHVNFDDWSDYRLQIGTNKQVVPRSVKPNIGVE